MIEIKKLYVKYPKLSVIEDISFSVKARELISIVGMSGCGKTTLLKTIGGLLTMVRLFS